MEKITPKPKKNLSLWPLKPEEALALFMKVDPKTVLEMERLEKETEKAEK